MEETLSEAVSRLSEAIQLEPDNAGLYFERGTAYFNHENWHNAADDFSKAIELNPGNVAYLIQRGISFFNIKEWDKAIADFEKTVLLEKNPEYHLWLCKACEQKQDTQTTEEQMAPYIKIKDEILKIDKFPDFKTTEDYTEFVAAMAFLEEYDLLKRLFDENPDLKEVMLNTLVRPQFAYWQPSPLFFITTKKRWTKMNAPCKMLRFLHDHGANINLTAGDGSTPLWDQAVTDSPVEILEILLELGADPNQISLDGEFELTPLISCLLPETNNENEWLPLSSLVMEKSKLLLKYGADINLTCPALPGFSPLMSAICYCFPPQTKRPLSVSTEALEFIEFLLKNGADPNFVDGNGNTPLSTAIRINLFEAGQLLLLYGAKMTNEPEKY